MIYGSDQEFIDVALPFVEQGLDSREPTLVAVKERHVENLRTALGAISGEVTLIPVEDWYVTSKHTVTSSPAGPSASDGGRVRLMGEPPWALGHKARVRDWARHESVVNVAFASLL